jgi:hypothetical protein
MRLESEVISGSWLGDSGSRLAGNTLLEFEEPVASF